MTMSQCHLRRKKENICIWVNEKHYYRSFSFDCFHFGFLKSWTFYHSHYGCIIILDRTGHSTLNQFSAIVPFQFKNFIRSFFFLGHSCPLYLAFVLAIIFSARMKYGWKIKTNWIILKHTRKEGNIQIQFTVAKRTEQSRKVTQLIEIVQAYFMIVFEVLLATQR